MGDIVKQPISYGSAQLQQFKEDLLSLNSVTSAYGLSLTSEEVADILEARQMQQADYGLVEMTPISIEEIITQICTSSFVNSEGYAETIVEFQELYYYLMALLEEAEPELIFKLDPEYVVSFLKQLFEEYGGYIDAVRGKIERFFVNYNIVDGSTVQFEPIPLDDEDSSIVDLQEWENSLGDESNNG